jgi:predicted GIY-YIG superfamily endonuclease
MPGSNLILHPIKSKMDSSFRRNDETRNGRTPRMRPSTREQGARHALCGRNARFDQAHLATPEQSRRRLYKDISGHHLVWYEQHGTMEAAVLREKAIKERKRAWKLELIEKPNPSWQDLYRSLVNESIGARWITRRILRLALRAACGVRFRHPASTAGPPPE